jgi:hypothetical protein
MHVSTLFLCDAEGRLLYNREPGYEESELEPAPRFYLGRTSRGNIWRFRHDLPGALVRDLDQLCRSEPVTSSVANRPNNAEPIRAALNTHAAISNEECGPAYIILERVQASGNVLLISEANKHLLETNFPWALTTRSSYKMSPLAATVAEGNAVSICFCARLSPWAAEAGVVTAEEFRGQGHASAAVAGWASTVRQLGLIPLYSTWWENAASLSVARKLDMELYGVDWWVT